jgi:hypothetical protein
MQSAPVRLLNRSVRALAQTAGAAEWKEVLLDSASRFSDRVLLLRAGTQEFVLEGSRGLDGEARLTILRAAAPAIDEALRSGETIVALPAATELSHPVARWFEPDGRVYAIPLPPFAVLIAAAAGEADPLELLAAVAVLALRRRPAPDVVPLATLARDSAPRRKPAELRAHRFARVAVARMLLRHSSAVAAGRRGRSLYAALGPVIDAAREQYSARFLSEGARMADYLHEELVRTVAGNDESMLGAEYPGPLA